MENEKIVYCYNFRNIVMVFRRLDGSWFYDYNISDIFRYLNQVEGRRYNLENKVDHFDVGTQFGYFINNLLRKCRVEFGDPEIAIQLTHQPK